MTQETLSRVVVGYIGAYPGGRPAPRIFDVPIADDVTFYFALSFARDGNRDGIFKPVWDEQITPEIILQAKQNDSRKFLASLGGGDNFPWQEPADKEAWIRNATASLAGLMDTYHLDGIDVNYELGLGDTFVESIGRVAIALKAQKNADISITPFNATWSFYKSLWEQYGLDKQSIDWINYQSYADNFDEEGYLNQYANLAQSVGGYDQLVLGLASSTTAPRGLQPPAIYRVAQALYKKGILGVMIWSLEDSAAYSPPFDIERNVEQLLAG